MEKKKKKNKSNVENSVGYYDKTLLTEAKNDEAAVLVCTEPIVKVNTGEAPLKSFFVKEFQEGKEVVKTARARLSESAIIMLYYAMMQWGTPILGIFVILQV